MKKTWKRSVWGYSPKDFDRHVAKTVQEYKEVVIKLKEQLADEVHQIELIKMEINRLESEIAEYKAIEVEITGLLLQSHLDASTRIFAAIQESEKTERYAEDMVAERRAELLNLRVAIDNIREEISSVATHYLTVKGIAEGE
ncbi:MAG: hypothetical protein HGA27_03030 [Peptococcaceae bacterium]|nr:hypothetical protein [Peptococcaceae bacterium]